MQSSKIDTSLKPCLDMSHRHLSYTCCLIDNLAAEFDLQLACHWRVRCHGLNYLIVTEASKETL